MFWRGVPADTGLSATDPCTRADFGRTVGPESATARWRTSCQQLINGVTLGAIYGLIAIGYTMVYGIIGMINFAHGEIYMIGAFISLIAFLLLGHRSASPGCRWPPRWCC